VGRDVYCETTTSVHDRGRAVRPAGSHGHSSGPGLANVLAGVHSILAGHKIRQELFCCVTTRGPGKTFFQQQRDCLTVVGPLDHVDALPRPPHDVFGFGVTVDGPVVAWLPANASPTAGIRAPGNTVDSTDSGGKRDRIPFANKCDAAAAVWRRFPILGYAGAVPWEVLSPVRIAPGGSTKPSGALFQAQNKLNLKPA